MLENVYDQTQFVPKIRSSGDRYNGLSCKFRGLRSPDILQLFVREAETLYG